LAFFGALDLAAGEFSNLDQFGMIFVARVSSKNEKMLTLRWFFWKIF